MKAPMVRFTALIAVCALAHGCALLAPVPDRSRFFTLPVPSKAAVQRSEMPQVGSDAAPRIVYGLGPITLPAYLDRREVATRVSPTELAYSRTDLWAEPLTANVASVLRQSLSGALGTNEVVAYPWMASVKVDYQIQIGVLRFERDASGGVYLAGRWSIRDVRSGREVAAKDTVFTRPATPGDTQAAAAALSGTLSDLSQEIAAALRALPSPRVTPARRRT
jgi:uncharacterized lipoprotein YmbA